MKCTKLFILFISWNFKKTRTTQYVNVQWIVQKMKQHARIWKLLFVNFAQKMDATELVIMGRLHCWLLSQWLLQKCSHFQHNFERNQLIKKPFCYFLLLLAIFGQNFSCSWAKAKNRSFGIHHESNSDVDRNIIQFSLSC